MTYKNCSNIEFVISTWESIRYMWILRTCKLAKCISPTQLLILGFFSFRVQGHCKGIGMLMLVLPLWSEWCISLWIDDMCILLLMILILNVECAILNLIAPRRTLGNAFVWAASVEIWAVEEQFFWCYTSSYPITMETYVKRCIFPRWERQRMYIWIYLGNQQLQPCRMVCNWKIYNGC